MFRLAAVLLCLVGAAIAQTQTPLLVQVGGDTWDLTAMTGTDWSYRDNAKLYQYVRARFHADSRLDALDESGWRTFFCVHHTCVDVDRS